MPTKRPRHTTTETPSVEKARAARSRLAEIVRRRSLPIDVEAANAVKRLRRGLS